MRREAIACVILAVIIGAAPLRLLGGEKELTVPKDGLKIDGALQRTDPSVAFVDPDKPNAKPQQLPAHAYRVRLAGNKPYRIAMTAANQKVLDSFLVVQDAAGKTLAIDDDGGVGVNARLSFRPPSDGVYKVCAAVLEGQGRYTLWIYEEPILPGALPAAEQKRLAQMNARLNQLNTAGKYAEALALVREMHALREKVQGKQHWETLNVFHEIDLCRRRADLAADKQPVLAAVMRLRAEARGLEERGDDRAAAQACLKALQLCRTALGEKHPDVGIECFDLAALLNRQARYDDALGLAENALAIWRDVLGAKHPNTARGLDGVGAILVGQGKYADAHARYQQALDIRRAALGEKHPDTAASYHSLGEILFYLGKLEAAQAAFEKALTLQREVLGEKHEQTAKFYDSLAGIRDEQGKYAGTQELYQKALDIRLEHFGEVHPETAVTYHNLGASLSEQGKYAAAQPVLRKALDAWIGAVGERHPDTASTLQYLGINLNNQGKYAEAQGLFERALDVRRETLGETHVLTATSYFRLGWNLDDQGRHAAAEPLNRKALELRVQELGEKHRDTASAYNSVALNMLLQHKYAAAQPLFEKALAIWLAELGEKCPEAIAVRDNLGRNLTALERYAEAEQILEKNLAISLEYRGEKHPDTGSIYRNLARLLTRQGRFAAALPVSQKAFDLYREVFGAAHPDTAVTGNLLAASLHALGRHAEAEKALRPTVFAHDVSRLDRASSGFERAIGVVASPRPRLAALLARRGDHMEAWKEAEANLARGLLDDLAVPTGQPEQDAKADLAALHTLDEQLVPLFTNTRLDADQATRRDQLLRERQTLLNRLAQRAAQSAAQRVVPLAEIQRHVPADTALVFWIDAEPDYWACVVRREGPPRWEALPGTGAKGAWTDGDRDMHLKLYDALATTDKIAQAERTKWMSALARQRVEPLRKHLQAANGLPAVRRLLVVPTGALAQVPLETLTGDYTISYVPSGSVFARLAQQHRALQASPLLALGNPDYALPSTKTAPPPATGLLVQLVVPEGNAAKAGLHAGDVLLRYNNTPLKSVADLKLVMGGEAVKVHYWRDGKEEIARLRPGNLGASLDKRPAPEAVVAWRKTQTLTASLRSTGHQPLPASRYEVEAIGALVGTKDTTVLLGSDASEQALDGLGKDRMKRFRVLHFATHGAVDIVDPYRSALILAQDQLPDKLEVFRKQEKIYDGRLTVEKILRHWELDADLIVLSACQTALGKEAEGEGLLGFAQAFLQKGARSVLLSRWKVDDTATALLMLRFYENALGTRKGLQAPLGRAAALQEARTWLRDLSRVDAERLAVGLTGGVLRGTERDDVPLVQGKATLPPGPQPFAHPFYWASFVLIGDPD
jgi:tetratricopeptide (TPR) repeat protein